MWTRGVLSLYAKQDWKVALRFWTIHKKTIAVVKCTWRYVLSLRNSSRAISDFA